MKFKDYIQGNRYGKTANQLEREALSDPFLQEAIDGYDTTEGDFVKDLNELEKRLRKKTHNGHERQFNYKKFFSVAAVIVLLIVGACGAWYWWKYADKDSGEPLIAKNEKAAPIIEEEIAVLDTETEQANDFQEPIAAGEQERITPASEKRIAEEVAKAEDPSIDEHQEIDAEIVAVWEEDETTAFAAPIFQVNKLSGVVTDRDSKEPLAFVEIALLANGKAIADTYTDFNGKFLIPNIPNVHLEKIRISATGYDTENVSVSKENLTDLGGGAYQLDVSLRNQLSRNVIADASLPELEISKQLPAQKEVAPQKTERQPAASGSLGTQEFLQYFEENRKQNICDGARAEVTVSFIINAQGKPDRIFIKKSDCDALRQEVIRLLGKSPQWPQQKGTVEMKIRVN